jgi:hypothetical protein
MLRRRYAALSKVTGRRERSKRAVFVLLVGDDGLDAKVQQILVDPLRSVTLVTGERDGPGHRLPMLVVEGRVGATEQGVDHRQLVGLASAETEVEGVALPVTQDVDLRTPAAPGAPQRVIPGFC